MNIEKKQKPEQSVDARGLPMPDGEMFVKVFCKYQ